MDPEYVDDTDMSYIPSADAFVKYLEAHPLKPTQRDLLLAHYAAPDHAARTVEIADTLGVPMQSVHSIYGHLGRRLEKHLGIELPAKAIPTHVFSWFEPRDDSGFRDLFMHDAVVEAIERLGWDGEAVARFGDAYESARDENAAPAKYLEGRVREARRIERARNGRARQECIEAQGTVCVACGFDFGQFYGEHGEGFIEVHHLAPIAAGDGEREINPKSELRPVCSNCHRMLHRGGSTIPIDELVNLITAAANAAV